MKRLVSSFAFIFVLAVPVFTQQTSPTRSARDEVVKISTNLIQIDVTGLTKKDFEVFEKGEKQDVSNFSLVSRTAAGAAVGDTMVAGYKFHNNAFADNLLAFSGTWRWYPGDGTSNVVGTDDLLEAQLVGANIDSHAFCIAGSECNLDIGFIDNTIVNGSGADLAVFELGGSDVVRIVIGGISRDYPTSWTGYNYNGAPIGHLNQINVALVNLDDFGISALGSVSTLQAQSLRTDGHSPTYTLFGALNNGPPTTAARVGIGGRLLTAYGQPVSTTRVTLSDMTGASRSALSSSLGYYRFDDVEVGQTYMLSVKTRRFRFQPVAISVFGELTEWDLIAEP